MSVPQGIITKKFNQVLINHTSTGSLFHFNYMFIWSCCSRWDWAPTAINFYVFICVISFNRGQYIYNKSTDSLIFLVKNDR
jgi:hypothetical protein